MRPVLALVLALSPFAVVAQAPSPDNAVTRAIDPEIAAFLNSTKAFDNHAHPVLPAPGDREFDALPVDSMEPETDVLAWRDDNPQLLPAWQALWHFTPAKFPLDADGMKQLQAARAAVRTREGTHFDEWLLDQSGIATQVANRVAMGDGVTPAALPLGPVRRRAALPTGQLDPGRRHARQEAILSPRRQGPRPLPCRVRPQNHPTHAQRVS